MNKVKLSTLPKDTVVLVEGYTTTDTVEDILSDLESFRTKKVYTTTEYHASFDAGSILESAIENEYQDMYEGWDESISADVTDDDKEELQKILDRILSRSPSSNIAYNHDKLIVFDV